MQREATAKPRTEGMAASQRQPEEVRSRWKPSKGGRSQNQRARKEAPTRREAVVVSAGGRGAERCGDVVGEIDMIGGSMRAGGEEVKREKNRRHGWGRAPWTEVNQCGVEVQAWICGVEGKVQSGSRG
jgi:hypothetical protein